METTNKVHLIGHLGADAEGFLTKNSLQGAKFRIATSSSWMGDNGEARTVTDWHRVVVFGQEAKNALDGLRKGRLVEVEGRITTRSYLDKQNQKRSSTSIVADRVTLLEAPKSAEASK